MASKRLVMCTSTGCIDYAPAEYKKYNIDILRIHLSFRGTDYLEGYDLEPDKFYAELETLEDAKNNLPKTSMPNVEEINAHFEAAIANGYDEVIAVCISAYLSNTYSAVVQAAKAYEDRLKVTVIDTKTNSFNEGYLAIKAAQLVEEGVPTETVIKELNWIMKTQEFFGVDGKLDYLIYNGRLKGGKAFIGKMMSICPIVGFDRDGVLGSMESVRTQKKALNRACEILKEKIGDRAPEDYLLWHCYTGTSLLDQLKEIEQKHGIQTNHPAVIMSPTSGCHNGPWFAGYGLLFLRRDDEPLED
ncbi:MAG: DegV family protein [Clostridia bacterium]|nr:DegV family protein [Clostridia bacterium]